MRPFLTVFLALLMLPVPAFANQFEDGKMFEEGMMAYDSGDFLSAVELWQPLADKGDPKAQYWEGEAHQHIKGVAPDWPEIMKWFRKSADQGYADAQCEVGLIYESNRQGIGLDYIEAAKWYRKAAEQGNMKAEWALGNIYYWGGSYGKMKDYAEAFKWFLKAADQGDYRAQDFVAGMYEKGIGVKQDTAQALIWRARYKKNRPWIEVP